MRTLLIFCCIIILIGCNSTFSFFEKNKIDIASFNENKKDSTGFLHGTVYFIDTNNNINEIEFSHGYYLSYTKKILYKNGGIRADIGEPYYFFQPIGYENFIKNNYRFELKKIVGKYIDYKRFYNKDGTLINASISFNDDLNRYYSITYFKKCNNKIKTASIKNSIADTLLIYNRKGELKKCIVGRCANTIEEDESLYYDCDYQQNNISTDSVSDDYLNYINQLFHQIDTLSKEPIKRRLNNSPVMPSN